MKRTAAALIAAALLPLAATPAMADTPATSTSTTTHSTAGQLLNSNPKPIKNKAGVREILQATSAAKSGIRAANYTLKLIKRLEQGKADGSMSVTAQARLEARIAEGSTKTKTFAVRSDTLAYTAYDLHRNEENRISELGREAVDSRSWTAAVAAFETTMARFVAIVESDPVNLAPFPYY